MIQRSIHTDIHDPARLQTVQALGLIDTPTEEAFDRLTRLAARLLHVPVTMVTIIDDNNLFIKSGVGLPAPWQSHRRMTLSHCLCMRDRLAGSPLHIENARNHPAFRNNPTVRELNIASFLSTPLITNAGYVIGTLSAADYTPRTWNDDDIEALEDVAGAVISEMTARMEKAFRQQAETELRISGERFQSLMETTTEGFYLFEMADPISVSAPVAEQIDGLYKGAIVECNNAQARMYGYERREQVIGKSLAQLHGGTNIPENRAFLSDWIRNGYLITGALSRETDREGNTVWFSNNVTGILEHERLVRIWGTQTEVTEMRRTEEKLREQQTRLAAILEGTHVGTWEWNVQTGETIFNDRWADIVGYKLAELSPVSVDTWEKLTHPDDLAQSAELLSRHFSGELEYYECECRMRHKDGSWVWVLDRGKLLSRTTGGAPLMMFGTHTDITERKRTEQALSDALRFNKRIAEVLPLVLYVTELASGDTIYINREVRQVLGYSQSQVRAMGREFIPRIMHPDDRAAFAAHIESIADLPDGAIAQFAYRMRAADGTWRWILSRDAVFARDQQNAPTQILGTGLDITEQKRAEQELRESEQRYRLAQHLAKIGSWEWNITTDTVVWSEDTLAIFGIENSAFGGRFDDVAAMIDHEDLRVWRESVRECIEEGKKHWAEIRITRPSGEQRWIGAFGDAERNAEGQAVRMLGVVMDITERKQAETLTARERDLSNQIIDSIPGLFYLIDQDMRFLRWNKTLEKQSGYSSNALSRLHPLHLFGGADRELIDHSIRQVFETGEASAEARLISSDGGSVPYSFTGTRIFFNTRPCLIGVGIDISPRVQSEISLRKSEKWFRKIFENAPSGIAITNWEGIYEQCNRAFCELLGRSSAELSQIVYASLVHPEDREANLAEVRRLQSGEIPFFEIENRYIHKFGHAVWVHKYVSVLTEENGRPAHLIALVTDISERMRAALQLRESEERYRNLVQYSPDAIIVIVGNRVSLANKACIALFKARTENDLIGKPSSELFQPGDRAKLQKRIHHLRDMVKPVSLAEERIVRMDGSVVDVDVLAAPFSYANTRAVHVIIRDITERKVSENRIKGSLREKETLLQEIYHRTKNNMMVISSFLELQAAEASNEKVDRIIHESTTRIRTMSLAHEMLYKGKSLSRIAMQEYISSLVNLFAAGSALFQQQVSTRLAIDAVDVLIDIAIPCGLIINELFTNCAKHAFPNGRAGLIEISFRRIEGRRFELKVDDNGVGLPPGFDIMHSPSLGVQLVLKIARHQLHAAVEARGNHGLHWRIVFDENLYSERV